MPDPEPEPAPSGDVRGGLGGTAGRVWARWQGKWHALPLRTRLATLLTALLVAGLGVTGIASVTLLGRYLVGEVDGQLTRSAVALAESAVPQLMRSDGNTPLPSTYYILWSPLGGAPIEAIQPATRRASGVPDLSSLTVSDVIASDGEPFTARSSRVGHAWRVVAYPVTAGETLTGTVAVALPLSEVDQTVAQLVRVLLLSGSVIVVLGAVAGSMAVRRALRPLRDVEATAQAFAGGDLTRRVPSEPPSTEVGRLAISLNGMLAQIEEAFAARAASEARMRRFVADASHELRTPLATVRGYGELYRMGGIGADDVGPAMRRIEDEAVRMGALVSDLLQLAKLDEGRPLALAPVDLGVLAADAAVDLRALDPTRAVRVVSLAPGDATGGTGEPGSSPPGDGPLVVCGDEHRLRQVVANLVGNVAQHTPAGTPVEIALGRTGAATGAVVVLEVRDHGLGIPAGDAERVFERFYRVDASRTRASGGSGLGLAIVAAIVGAHGGTVRVRPTPGGGTTVRVELPEARGARDVCHDEMPELADQG